VEFDLPHTISLLSRTPVVLNALLRDLPEAWTVGNEGENTWSPFQVVAHLIHAEHADWIPRAKMILQFGEARVFEPFDRSGHNRYIRGKSPSQLLDEFARVRAKNIVALQDLRLRTDDFKRCGRHPAFGTVTLSQLLATWAAHDMTHLHQLSRVMAHQYREAVGPWRAYLGVLRCDAHSSPA
jgi:hypothetical protein